MATVLIVCGVVLAVPLAMCVIAGVRNVVAERPKRAARWAEFRAERGEGWQEAKQSAAADWKKMRGRAD